MAEELQHLIERIRKEGVESGEKAAESLVAEAKQKAAKIAARDPGWHAFVEEIREEYADQKAWLEKRIESQDKRIEEMKDDLSRTKAAVDRLDRLYRAALDVIRDFMRRHPSSDVVVPDEIRHDL